jgi:hypothetical protein
VYQYRTFGLTVQTAVALPELFPAEEGRAGGKVQADVTIRVGEINNLPPAVRSSPRYVWPSPEGIYLGWEGVGAFLVREGREVIVEPCPGVEESLLRLFILGTTLAMLLHQRGEVVVLHASVVVMAGEAVAFVGAKGLGKSTMAAALHSRGHDLLSDDILAVDLREDNPLALPGFPQLKLWPDALSSLGCDAEALPRLRPELEKRAQFVNAGFTYAPVPLKRIFVLGVGAEPMVELLQPWEVLRALMPHWYGARFGAGVLRALGLGAHFLQCAELGRKVPVYRLKRPKDLTAMPEVVRLVESCSAQP